MKNYKEIKPEELNKSPFQLIGNEWMLISAEKDNKANTMTASWGGFGIMWNKNVAYMVLRPQRYTKEFIDGSDRLSLTFFPEEYKKQLSYLGTVSGRDEDKITKSNLTLDHYEGVPYFEEASLVIICKKLFAQAMSPDSFIYKDLMEKNYPNKDYHTLYIAEVEKIFIK